MAPGVNRLGRSTGTVPKTKTPNNSGRDNAMAVSRTPRSNIPNNLSSQDWQATAGPSTNRTRKTSNTKTTVLDYYDASEERVVHENSKFVPPENQEQAVSLNRSSLEVNGVEASPSSSCVRRDCVRRPLRNVMPDTEDKSNISKMPDRNQISSRLNQIREYIQQTSSIMESLKSSGKPSHLAQYHKLAGMVTDLRDSEVKLAALLNKYEDPSPCNGTAENSNEEENASVEADRNVDLNHELENGFDLKKSDVNKNEPEARNRTEENGAVLKTTDGSRCNELRMKLEESQKKLQAMQEHQAVLQALQQQTQQQLIEARAAQSSLLARTAAAAAVAATSSVSEEEQSPESLRGNLDVIRERLYALKMYDPRNSDKLQELQCKKERMDHLVAEFQTESNGMSGAGSLAHDVREKSCDSSKDGSEDGEEDGHCSDIECDVEKVRQKMAQLSAMKAQLRRLQNLVDTGLHDTESAAGEEASFMHMTENDGDDEEAINIRRQRQGKGRSVSRTNSTSSTATKPDNISQASMGNMQDSEVRIERKTQKLREAKSRLHQLQTLLSTVMELRSRGEPVPEHYLQMLEEETSRADQDQTLEAVQDARSQHPVNIDRDREDASALIPTTNGITHDSSEVTIEMVQAMALELQTQTQCLREEKERLMRARQEIGKHARDLPFREKKTNTQLLLQAKRRELEELMRKDKGQSSAVNQDICSEAGKSDTAGFSYVGEGTSAATWGGSTQGTLDDLAERDDDVREQSAGYSSDDMQDDESNQHYISSQMNHSHPLRNTTSSSSNNNSNNNNAVSKKKECLAQSTSTNRETLSMSVESGGFGGSQCGHNSNSGSIGGTFPQSQALPGVSQQRPGPRNVWRKSSTDSSATLPRAVWTPTSQHPCAVEEMAANVNLPVVNSSINQHENGSNASNITQINQSQSSSSMQSNWWQQQAMQLQSQLDATNNLYQSLLLEQHQHQQQQQQHNFQCWPQPPALTQMPSIRPPLAAASAEAFYQQLLAATQFQQQQLLLTTVNQCCHLLWMQQREMSNLRGVVMTAAAHGPTGPPPWLQQASSGAAPGLLSAHASSSSPVPALNNQVPPGNRANNYWDNFRSYSRQNLLSTSTKSNEGVSHSPSPLVDRSRNTLRNPASFAQPPHAPQPTTYPVPEQGMPQNLSRKEKLNIERYHSLPDTYTLPSNGVPDITELHYQSQLLNNQYHNTNMQIEHQQLGARALPTSLANNMSGIDGRGSSSWHNRSGARSYRSQRGVNCKRKNPRSASAIVTENAPSSSSVASTPQDRSSRRHRDALSHRSGCSLFDVLSESVYTEVAALIAVNESRPHFLIQLFRDLQMVSSDPLRQRTLQSIHELVSRYLAEASRTSDEPIMHQNAKPSQSKDTVHNDSPLSSDDDGNPKMVVRNSGALQSMHAPPHNGVWSTNDELTIPNVLQGHNEWELEAVLEDLLPFLKGHLEEICSPALLEAVRQQAVQLMLAQTQAHCRPSVPGNGHQPAGGYFQGQLDALLEDGLNKFQGCRLRDVCEDLLMVITDILQSELTFLKLVDTVRREVDESSEDACKNPASSEDPVNSVHTLQLAVESAVQVYPSADINSQNRLESVGSAEGYNGDLAEADQSHHEEAVGGASPQHAEGEMAGAVVPEDSDDDGLLEIMQNEMLRPEENQDGLALGIRDDCEDRTKTEAEDEWAVEQDREQGLDRVPIRLSDELDGQERLQGQQANHSDATSNP